jgi:D-3-phosphoglycerate dehydrogenase
MGQMIGVLAGGAVSPLKIDFEGEIAGLDTRLLSSAVIAGVLSGHIDESVNLVNAASLAEERGIEWIDSSSQQTHDYRNMLTLTTGEIAVSGTTIGVTSRPRLTGLLGFNIEIELDANMAVFRYSDVPGVIGRVGSILGEAGVNIAHMAVGRLDGEALMALTFDSPVPLRAQEQIRALDGFDRVWFVNLPG